MSKKSVKKNAAAKRPKVPVARSPSTAKAEERAFVASLVAHGQAVAVAAGAKLPPGATHELTTGASGRPKVVRKRFSAI